MYKSGGIMKFAAFLLFQFKTTTNDIINKKRICEERIYNINTTSSEDAYLKANQIGKEEEFSYNDEEKLINFEFIGIVDLIELSDIDDENLVWSRFQEKVNPMERKSKLIPKKENLTVFKTNKRKLKL